MIILRVMLIAIISLVIGSLPVYADGSFSQVVVFGDSNVDAGEAQEGSLFNLSGGLFPGPPNVGGRSCNGPVVVEYVAEMLRVPLVGYGVGGARTDETNVVFDFIPLPQFEFTGVLSQLQTFIDSLGKKKADSRALYVYWAGSNDLFGATPNDLPPRVDAALENVETALTALTNLGARYILVATRTIRPEYYDENNVNGVILNARLRILVQRLNEELKAKIQIFEAFDLITDMTYNPSEYGFVETTARCAFDPDCANNPEVGATYITWDDAHKTTRVHEIMAEALVFQALKLRRGMDDDDEDDDDDDDEDDD